MKHELVSIITPVYRGQQSIAECVSSALKQTYEHWEMLIISDDGWDYRVELERKGIIDERLRFFSTQGVAQGVAYARNIALRNAQGQWITQLDVDDLYYPTRLQRLMDYAVETGLAVDNGLLIDSDNGQFLANLLETTEETKFRLKDFKRTFAPLNFLYSKTLTRDGWCDLPRLSDLLFNLQLMERAGWANLVSANLHECRVTGQSLSQHLDASSQVTEALSTLIHWIQTNQAGFEGAYYRNEVSEYLQFFQALFQQYLDSQATGFEGHFARFAQSYQNGKFHSVSAWAFL